MCDYRRIERLNAVPWKNGINILKNMLTLCIIYTNDADYDDEFSV